MLQRACFIDRDGCINANDKIGNGPKYVLKWEDFRFLPGVLEALKLLSNADYLVIVISNQSCVGRSLAKYRDIEKIFISMQTRIWQETDIHIKYLFCPHAPDAGCACRKPKPGMIWKAAIEHSIDLSASYVLGDSPSDMEAGALADIPNHHRIFIDANSKGDFGVPVSWIELKTDICNWGSLSCRRVDDLLEAARLIIQEAK